MVRPRFRQCRTCGYQWHSALSVFASSALIVVNDTDVTATG